LLIYDSYRSTWSATALKEPDALTSGGATSGAIADSFYSLTVSPKWVRGGSGADPTSSGGLSIAADPGGPAATGEPGARIVFDRYQGAGGNDSADNLDVYDQHLAGVRLVSADGDNTSPPGNYTAITGDIPNYNVPGYSGTPIIASFGRDVDGLLDWAVGDLSGTCYSPGLTDCQGAAYTTLRQTQLTPNPLTCTTADDLHLNDPRSALSPCGLSPQVQNGGYANGLTAGAHSSSELMSLPSYSLNSITDVPNSPDSTIWAVGDKGAILRKGGNGAVGSPSEPAPPVLGAQQSAALPDRSVYDPFRPPVAAAEPGVVPALASRPLERLAAPSLLAAGSPDPDTDLGGEPDMVVMSRDGSEGWAMTDFGHTLDHYSGGNWTACDPTGIAGQLAPHAACSSLADVFRQGASFNALARVPTENGSDPSKASDFEVMAIGLSPRKVVARYRDGRWEVMDGQQGRPDWAHNLDSHGLTPDGLAFTAPDDGWLVAADGRGGQTLYHFGGADWTICVGGAGADPSATGCGHPAAMLSSLEFSTQGHFRLAVAGRRVYLAGTRLIGSASTATPYPMIYYKDPGVDWTRAYDPGCTQHKPSDQSPSGCLTSDSAQQGTLTAISVAQLAKDRFAGWAAGTFGASSTPSASDTSHYIPPWYSIGTSGRPGLLRLDPGQTSWRQWPGGDAVSDYLVGPFSVSGLRLTSTAGPDGQERSFLLPPPTEDAAIGDQLFPLLDYDAGRARWQVLATPFFASGKTSIQTDEAAGQVLALAPDGAGGLWLAARATSAQGGDGTAKPGAGAYFYHYTDRWPLPVFSDLAHPIREPIVGAAAGDHDSLWVATASGAVYRHDRVTGWDRMTIPGWDAERVATNHVPAYAVATGPGGSGLVVGKGGRIADLTPEGGVLDAASGVLCSARGDVPPCSTSYSLRAASVAPDGSAIVGGDHMALLWGPPNAGFRSISKPPERAHDTRVTGLSMPIPGRAWLTTDAGQVFAGTATHASDGSWTWTWKLEADASALTQGWDGKPLQVHAIAIDSSGRGLAVGSEGLVLERDADGSWRRLDASRLDTFYSVALPPGGYGDGALIGGELGLILTRVHGQFQVAQPTDYYSGLINGDTNVNSGRIVGVVALSGYRPGEVEAWAALQMQPQNFRLAPWPGALLHYTNAPSDSPLDDEAARARALPDSPAPQPGEVSFAAFGKQECQLSVEPTCPEMHGTNFVNEVIARAVNGAIVTRSRQPGGPTFSVFTGDAGNSGGRDQGYENAVLPGGVAFNAPLDTDVIHHRWNELVAEPLQDAGLPLFGALGDQDLSQTSTCMLLTGGCHGTRQAGNPGPSLPWREAFAAMPAPWGAQTLPNGQPNGPPTDSHGLSYSPVPESGVEGPSASVCPTGADAAGQHVPGQTPPVGPVSSRQAPCSTPGEDTTAVAQALSPSGQDVPYEQVASQDVPSQSVAAGGAHTHYAVDVCQGRCDQGAKRIVRLVVVDTSLKTLSGAAGTQNPVEEQLKWLTDVLSSRPSGEKAVVVSETPSYSYGPGSTSDTLTDSAAFETLMGRERVSAVVSGRLGWNGLYYTSTAAPGLHCPQPGGAYPDPGAGCDPALGASGPASQATQAVGAALGQALAGGAPGAPPSNSLLGAYPTVVTASAGGKFGPADNPASGSANQGLWHGYSVIRIEPDGSVVVEQRPVLDWIGVSAIAHDLRPGQHMTLHGYGREPVGTDAPIRYDDINSAAITHHFDLVRADPQRPWLPLVDPARVDPQTDPPGYVPLGYASAGATCTDQVACIDQQSGQITTGHGNHPRVYAIGILSVGDKAATWPIAFEPRRNYRAATTTIIPPLSLPPIHVAAATVAPVGNAPPPPPPAVPSPSLPPLPNLPALPPLSSSPPPAPPAPPAAPPPPSFAQALPLSINPQLTPISITATVVPPSPPPVNPAPPSGSAARKEARQRQAAAAKSEEGADPKQAEVDLAQDAGMLHGTNQMTRRDRAKPGPSFTPLAQRAEQPSAWPRDLLYGGGLTLIGLTLALGWLTVRPTPRRRTPAAPAPAWARQRPDRPHR
jgi:hypothetical protein